MGFWGAVGSIAGGAAAGGAGGLTSWGLGRSDAKQAWKRQKKVLQRGFSWRVADIRRAGYNPLLAFQGSGISGGVTVPMAKGPGNVDLAGGISRVSQSRLMQQQTATARAAETQALAAAQREQAAARLTGAQAAQEELVAAMYSRDPRLREAAALTSAFGDIPGAVLWMLQNRSSAKDKNEGGSLGDFDISFGPEYEKFKRQPEIDALGRYFEKLMDKRHKGERGPRGKYPRDYPGRR